VLGVAEVINLIILVPEVFDVFIGVNQKSVFILYLPATATVQIPVPLLYCGCVEF